jgi:hypothetical protein
MSIFFIQKGELAAMNSNVGETSPPMFIIIGENKDKKKIKYLLQKKKFCIFQ